MSRGQEVERRVGRERCSGEKGMGGPIRAGCLGEEAEKTGNGAGRERIWHSAQRQRNCPPTLALFPIVHFALNFCCCVCKIAL